MEEAELGLGVLASKLSREIQETSFLAKEDGISVLWILGQGSYDEIGCLE